jgi:hypothetical protein
MTVLPEQIFVRATEVLGDYIEQDKDMLKAWIDPHQLKMHRGIWYKEGRQVVMVNI